jgi:hypothetical protein
MKEKKSVSYYILLIICGYFLFGHTIFQNIDIFYFVLRNPSHLPFYIVYISVGIISLIAWLVVRYRGRPINPSTYPSSLLHDDHVSSGYIDYKTHENND